MAHLRYIYFRILIQRHKNATKQVPVYCDFSPSSAIPLQPPLTLQPFLLLFSISFQLSLFSCSTSVTIPVTFLQIQPFLFSRHSSAIYLQVFTQRSLFSRSSSDAPVTFLNISTIQPSLFSSLHLRFVVEIKTLSIIATNVCNLSLKTSQPRNS